MISHRRCSIEKDILKNFENFTGKHMKACNFIKKRLQHRCFSVKFAKSLSTPILKNICERLFRIKNLRILRIKNIKGNVGSSRIHTRQKFS